VLTWPAGRPLGEHLETLKAVDLSEHLRVDGGGRWTAIEIDRRLDELAQGMRYGQTSPSSAEAVLEDVGLALLDRNDIQSRYQKVRTTELLASARCHLGDTKSSEELTQSILQMKAGVGSSVIAEVLLRQAVNFTDFADYPSATEYCDKADKLTGQLADPVSQLDNHLKSISSKSQATMFWAMVEPSHIVPALQMAEEAVRIARDLDAQ